MKKFLSAILVLLLALCISGCNNDTNNDSKANKNTQSNTETDTVVVPNVVGDSQNNSTELPSDNKTNNSNLNYYGEQNNFTSVPSPSQGIMDNSSTTDDNTVNQINQSENHITEEEKTNRALQRQNVNISELESELNSQFSQIDIGIDVWQLKIKVSKNNDKFFSEDLWIKTDYSTSLFTPHDLKYSIDITNEQKDIAISALKDMQQKIYNYVHSKYQYLKIKGGFYNGFYKYPSLRVGYESIRFCSWTNYGQDICFTGAYDFFGMTDFGWHAETDDYVY